MLKPFPDLPLHRVALVSGPDHYKDAAAVRQAVDQALESLQLPSDFARPGDRVVLKPNWVKEHDERHPGPNQWEHVVTHPTLIEAVAFWVAEKMGQGSVTICDAPQTDSSFERLRQYCQLDQVLERC